MNIKLTKEEVELILDALKYFAAVDNGYKFRENLMNRFRVFEKENDE